MKELPPLPEPVIVPHKILERWHNLPPHHLIVGSISRSDWDNLFYSLDHAIAANAALQSALIAYSNGDMEAANAASWESSRRSAEAQNKLRQLMMGVMASQ